ncbi:PhnD/SsuA/transferrin family substrate-binding protein [Rhizobium sp. 1AS11]|uniref:PhnD/SsuA/transferrin family substrate-binding protein n=1 Tax=Rhizobium acaciae TaxID=2989736 RepID=UPI0022218649|nr:PhnD/SsuA/transferrin family substrate-binding protein [Rhizobium acaciae]MCW1411299.1 PhnD/SsuA/transferrin family substrate-binding protein [Rhizobium acaciae]MCW1743289.1 PhnD/SsuA/transferrin family substrate-binding protein [Rhizobium acaciae]
MEDTLVAKVKLDISIAEYPHTEKILSGEIEIEGVEPNFISVKPQIGAYRRMVRNHEFDVCEIAPTTYIIARAYGAPFVGLPIFLMRQFNHSTLLVRPDADIKVPKDLEGHKVGVRAYSVTTGVWLRAALVEDFGLDSSKVTWVVDDEEHVLELELPPNVIHTENGRSLADMMADGELVAGFAGNAGVGRSGAPTGGWQVLDADYPKLLPDAPAVEMDYFARTGIYPIHGMIVVKDEVLALHPWVAKSLHDAFAKAKAGWLEGFNSGASNTKLDEKYRKLSKIVGPDPLPYGLAQNMPSIEALARAAENQKMTPRLMQVSELFVDPEKI